MTRHQKWIVRITTSLVALAVLVLTAREASAQALGSGEGTTNFFYTSDGDCFSSPYVCDPVGRGASATVSDPLTDASRNVQNGVRLDFSTPLAQGNSWFMDFSGPDEGDDADPLNDIELQMGVYNGAVSFENDPTGVPRFEVQRLPGTRCPNLPPGATDQKSSGNFEVTLVEYDQFGDVIRYDGTFDQFCFDYPSTGLHGLSVSYRINGKLGATALPEGNLLLTFRNKIWEFTNPPNTPNGPFQLAEAVGAIPVRRTEGWPIPGTQPDEDERLWDLAFDGDNNLHVFNGYLEGKISTLDLTTGAWRNDTFPGLAAGGEIAVWRDYVFVTNGGTIVRFDKSDNYSHVNVTPPVTSPPRFYSDITLGFDGRLYATDPGTVDSEVDVYDPDTLALLDTRMVNEVIWTLAVNARGEIFGGGPDDDGSIYRIDDNGFASASNEVYYLAALRDVDLSRDGKILVTDTFKGFAITDESLAVTTAYFLDYQGSGAYGMWIEPGVIALQLTGFETGDTTDWDDSVGEYAGVIEVADTAASEGTYGLKVHVNAPCADPNNHIVPGPTATGLFRGCTWVTTETPVEIVDPGATFAAGARIDIGNDFTISSDFTAVLDDGFTTRFGYVEEWLPQPSANYNAQFEINLDDLSLAEPDEAVFLVGVGEGDEREFRAKLIRNEAMGEDRMVLAARLDDGTWTETPFGEQVLLPVGWHTLRFLWRAAAGFGYFLVSVDGGAYVGLSTLDNGTRSLSKVQAGLVDGTFGASTSGSFFLDDFSSWQ